MVIKNIKSSVLYVFQSKNVYFFYFINTIVPKDKDNPNTFMNILYMDYNF